VSIAEDIAGKKELRKAMPVSKWKNTDIQIHKIPAILSFGQFP